MGMEGFLLIRVTCIHLTEAWKAILVTKRKWDATNQAELVKKIKLIMPLLDNLVRRLAYIANRLVECCL